MTTIVKHSTASAFTLPEQQAWTRSATFFEQHMNLRPRKQKALKKTKYLHQFHFNREELDTIGTHFFANNPVFNVPVKIPIEESYYTENYDLSTRLIPAKVFMVKARVNKISRFEPQVSLD